MAQKTVISRLRRTHVALIAERLGSKTGWNQGLPRPGLPPMDYLEGSYLRGLTDPQLRAEAEHHISVIGKERR